jgi:acyl-CoA reductase-like NAD-dependent aldehyde dehydrogenase
MKLVSNVVTNHRRLFINGGWQSPNSDRLITVDSANTGLPIGSVPHADPSDVDAAVGAARAAFDDSSGWSRWPPAARAQALRRLADAIDKRSAQIAALVSDQNGMPIVMSSVSDSVLPGHTLRYYADLLAETAGEEIRAVSGGGRTMVRVVPRGVVAAVVPWNFPNTLGSQKYAPALAAGCSVVLKPSPESVLDAVLIAEAVMEAGLPPGVVNIVPGGGETGAQLVAHSGVDMVSFTGSTRVGRQIGEICGRLLRPVNLELGGKSPAIVLDDADLDLSKVGQQLASALFMNNGQTCFVSSRVLAPRSRYGEVVNTIADLARSLVVGHSLDEATQIGPLVSARQRARVEQYIGTGKAQGDRLVVGGGRPADQQTGWFVEPTVFADVDNSHVLARQEIFGPVATITPYGDDDDAIRIANDCDYGLAGTVWTTDDQRGTEVARRIEAGTVGINHYMPDHNSPTSMIKASGVGVKYGRESLASFQRFQSIYL